MNTGGAMRIPMMIGSIILLGACSGASPRPTGDAAVAGHWQGVLLRNGLREPIAVDLSPQDRDWRGRFSAGDSMAGSISGGENGSFSLKRNDPDQPRWTIDFMMGP